MDYGFYPWPVSCVWLTWFRGLVEINRELFSDLKHHPDSSEEDEACDESFSYPCHTTLCLCYVNFVGLGRGKGRETDVPKERFSLSPGLPLNLERESTNELQESLNYMHYFEEMAC